MDFAGDSPAGVGTKASHWGSTPTKVAVALKLGGRPSAQSPYSKRPSLYRIPLLAPQKEGCHGLLKVETADPYGQGDVRVSLRRISS